MNTKPKTESLQPHSAAKCIDLRTVAGKRYRLDCDLSHKGRTAPDPWLLIIPCRFGHIYPHSATLLAVATNGRVIGLKVARLSGVDVLQDGIDGMNLTFPPRLFARVAQIVKPKRKRQISDAERERLLKLSQGNLAKRRQSPSDGDFTSAGTTLLTPVDALDVAV